MSGPHRFERSCCYLRWNCSVYFLLLRTSLRVILLAATLGGCAVAEIPPCEAPISQSDIRQIVRVIHERTDKPISWIQGDGSDKYVPGAVPRYTYLSDLKTKKTTPHLYYARTDRAFVYMQYSARLHVDVYVVLKLHGRWKIESKID
jgi:hypothetical protein